jgi:CspA family cold shock protein
LLQGTVYYTAKNGDLFLELKGIDPDEMMGRIAAANLAGKQYKDGNTVACELIAITEKGGEKIAECRPAGTTYRTGTVVRFDTERGYGFIKPDVGGQDIFVHKKQLSSGLERLTEGNRVKFRLARGPKGVEAQDVRKE